MFVKYPIKVAIVDDEPDVLETLKDFVEEYEEYEPLAFPSAEELLKYLENSDVHIAMIDINLVDMEGDELLEKLKGMSKGISVVMMTGESRLIKLSACFFAGADDIVLKPFTKDDFMEVINSRKRQLERWAKVLDSHLSKKAREH